MKKVLLTAAMITLSAGAFAGDDRIEREMHQDASFEQNRTKAVQMLEARGYQVRKIDADDHQGKPAFDVDALKDNKEFDIKLSYPDLRILKEKEDRF
ncbi:PepSY domain-containing protein [Neisseria sp.]|uniref:PepSY domain-containing protein n=1 Tax=Neisseria sp. TaxID=192066 RepID=UPI002896F089|nr:PepSY domain-containing protein [Neisseria sp.]